MSRAILGCLFFVIFTIACFCFFAGCSHKGELSEIVENVLDQDQKITIEITPSAKIK